MTTHKVDWLNHTDILDWKEVAEEKQKFYCTYLGKSLWEVYNTAELRYLKLKIAYSLFGPPLNLLEEDIEIIYKDPTYKNKINNIMSEIKKHGNSNVLYVSFIYLIAIIENKYSEIPVIRVHKKLDGKQFSIFIDTLGFSYENWELFLNTKFMPQCIYCYPVNGFYTWNELGQVELGYGYSNNSKTSSETSANDSSRHKEFHFDSYNISMMSFLRYKLASLTGIGLIEPDFKTVSPKTTSEPVFEAESVVRGVAGRAKSCWIKVASVENCCSVYAIHSTRSVAASLSEFERLSPLLAETLEKGMVQPNWLAVLNLMPEILRHSEKITYTHISQLFVSILFYCHTVISYDTCRQILQETLDHITNYTVISFSYRPIYSLEEVKDKIVKQSILQIKRIDNKAHLCDEILSRNESTDIETSIQDYELLQSLKKTACFVNGCSTLVFLEYVEDILQGLLQTVRERKNMINTQQCCVNSTKMDANS